MLGEQVLGLLGFGHIGQAVARRARAFGMRVLAYSRHPDAARAAELGVELVGREHLLAQSDYVSLHVPLSGETRGTIGGHAISLMKPKAVLINTARGGLVDEAALVTALRSGRLGGALLDVFQEAPLPLDHPLRDLHNVILTPHVGYYAEGVTARLRRLAAEAVRDYLG
jgi:phosphoglycerate dehydrogenase-like enzyme